MCSAGYTIAFWLSPLDGNPANGWKQVLWMTNYGFSLAYKYGESLLVCIDSIGNNMVSSAIWEKHARVSFSKTIFEKLTSVCFSKFHEKPYYYLLIIT